MTETTEQKTTGPVADEFERQIKILEAKASAAKTPADARSYFDRMAQGSIL